MKFLKNFGWGLLTIICLPFLLVALAVFAVYLAIVFFAEFFRSFIRFFKGEKGPWKAKEDLQVEAIKRAQFEKAMPAEAPAPATPAPAPQPSTPSHVYIQQNYYQGTKPEAGVPPIDATFGNPPVGSLTGEEEAPAAIEARPQAAIDSPTETKGEGQ